MTDDPLETGIRAAGRQDRLLRPSTTLVDLLLARAEAHAIRHAAGTELLVLEARRKVAEARVETEEQELELQFRRRLNALRPEEARRELRDDLDFQRLLLERERVRAQRLDPRGAPPLVRAAEPASLPAGEPPRLERDSGELELERLALKAAAHAAGLPPEERDGFWELWKAELARRRPTNVAGEVIRRAEALKRKFGDDG